MAATSRRARAVFAAALFTTLSLFTAVTPGAARAADPGDADLGLVFAPTTQTLEGQMFGVGYLVGNAGPAGATGVVVTLVFPSGLTPADTTACAPGAAGLVCTYPVSSIPAGSGVTGIVYLTAAAAGTYTITGTVTADQPDPVAADNTATLTVSVVAGADLTVQLLPAMDVTGPKTVILYSITVRNQGPSTATAVTLTDSWSSTTSGAIKRRSVTTDSGTCTSTPSGVDCALGDLAAGATATVTITLWIKGSTTITNQAQASSSVWEIYPPDNTATGTVVVSR